MSDQPESPDDSLILFHGSPGPIAGGRFIAYTHFGTLKAAIQRVEELLEMDPRGWMGYVHGSKCDGTNPLIYKVQLSIKNPAEVGDYVEYTWEQVIDDMLKHGRITEADAEELREDEDQCLSTFFENRGHDGLCYENTWEDAGHTSYIPFSSHQITILEVLTLDEARALVNEQTEESQQSFRK
jgi:hypothetical protein